MSISTPSSPEDQPLPAIARRFLDGLAAWSAAVEAGDDETAATIRADFIGSRAGRLWTVRRFLTRNLAEGTVDGRLDEVANHLEHHRPFPAQLVTRLRVLFEDSAAWEPVRVRPPQVDDTILDVVGMAAGPPDDMVENADPDEPASLIPVVRSDGMLETLGDYACRSLPALGGFSVEHLPGIVLRRLHRLHGRNITDEAKIKRRIAVLVDSGRLDQYNDEGVGLAVRISRTEPETNEDALAITTDEAAHLLIEAGIEVVTGRPEAKRWLEAHNVEGYTRREWLRKFGCKPQTVAGNPRFYPADHVYRAIANEKVSNERVRIKVDEERQEQQDRCEAARNTKRIYDLQ